jgi:hypothetical protein
LKASIVKRIEKLEEQFKPSEPELPPFDYDLLIESAYFSKQLTLLRTKARELGYGDKNNKVSWFDLRGYDPSSNEEVRMECLEALNDEERKVIETLQSTLIYIDLEKVLFNTKNDEFTVKVAENLEEACRFAEMGFEKFDEFEGKHLYRKRK